MIEKSWRKQHSSALNVCHLRISAKVQGVSKNRNLDDFFMFFRPENLFKNDPIRTNFIRRIDCAHFQRFLDSDSGNRSVCIEVNNRNFIGFLGVNLCGESIARISEAGKRFPDSVNRVRVLKR